MTKKRLIAAAIVSALEASDAGAVTLGTDNTGQALIFPYYTAAYGSAASFNTYLSVANGTSDTKAIRVRFREARGGREVASFNLFLGPHDLWTGAVIQALDNLPSSAALLSADRSCTSPVVSPTTTINTALAFSDAFYTGAFADNLGGGIDRTREGWVEMIEMATLTGTSAAAVTQNSAGVPTNCGAVQGNAIQLVAAPTGGLSGTLTLIDVATGMDFTVDADALADLSKRPFYRPATDSYPDFNATEIEPVSVVTDNGFIYRSTWNRGADAVSAVLMRSELFAEYILDPGTGSRSEFVVTLPTRQFYQTGTTWNKPFSGAVGWAPSACLATSTLRLGTSVGISYTTREGANVRTTGLNDFSAKLPSQFALCQAASVIEVTNEREGSLPFTGTRILGATGRGEAGALRVPAETRNGWASLFALSELDQNLVSLPSSTRTRIATDATTTGGHVYTGLPMTGLHLRTFKNGTLTCGGSLNSVPCQGNYGGSFPLKYQRTISPSN